MFCTRPRFCFGVLCCAAVGPLLAATANDAKVDADEQTEGQAIRLTLEQFNTAFEHKMVRGVKEIWPSVPARYVQAMGQAGASFIMSLRYAGDARISGDTAWIPCELVTHTTIHGRALDPTQKAVTVTLRKSGGRWILIDPFGPR